MRRFEGTMAGKLEGKKLEESSELCLRFALVGPYDRCSYTRGFYSEGLALSSSGSTQ